MRLMKSLVAGCAAAVFMLSMPLLILGVPMLLAGCPADQGACLEMESMNITPFVYAAVVAFAGGFLWAWRRRSRARVAATVILLLTAGAIPHAQAPGAASGAGPGGPPGIYKSAAEIAATLEKMGAVAKTGAAATVSEGIVVRRRSASDEPQFAIIHPLSIEVYQITEGSATLVTGGTLTLPLSDTAPDLVRSTSIQKGESRKVGKGDVVVLPPGTPHWFSAIDGSITYLEARIRVK